MDQQEVRLDVETVSCSICLDLLRDPVTIPCGHSYCMTCIRRCWDGEDRVHCCPQCRRSYRRKPELVKNTTLAAVVEEMKKTEVQAAPAGPEDVVCDVCTRRKRKAHKSCLVCLASYCEHHLQPHRDAPPLKRHKLVDPTRDLQVNICSQLDAVSAAAERKEKEKELEKSRQTIRQRIKEREEDLKALQLRVKDIKLTADAAVKHSQRIYSEMIRLMEKRSADVKEQIQSQQEAEIKRVQELQEKLEQEMAQLRSKDEEMQQLSRVEDHLRFLNTYPSVSHLAGPPASSGVHLRPHSYFGEVTAAVSESREKLQQLLKDSWTDISPTGPDGGPPRPAPVNRAELLKYLRELTMDPNTANKEIQVSEEDHRATKMRQAQDHRDHPERFVDCWQVLSRESLTGRCYWEVEWAGRSVYVAVAYKDVSRKGRSSCFGYSRRSWSLESDHQGYNFKHNGASSSVAGPLSLRVGVFLDHDAGLLAFYSVDDTTATLLHRVHAHFLRPLHAGVGLGAYTSAEFCERD